MQLCIKTLRILVKTTSIILSVGRIITKHLEKLWFDEFLNRSRVPSRRNIASFSFLRLRVRLLEACHRTKGNSEQYIPSGMGEEGGEWLTP